MFTMARNVYKACMDLDQIEEAGLEPLKQMLREMGGWPVLEGDSWNAEKFNWIDTVYTFRNHGYSTDYLIDFSIVTDSKVISIKLTSSNMIHDFRTQAGES